MMISLEGWLIGRTLHNLLLRHSALYLQILLDLDRTPR